MKRYFKIKTLLEHIRANGLPQTTGTLISSVPIGYTNQRKIVSACAIGMGALNLGVDELDLNNVLNTVKIDENWPVQLRTGDSLRRYIVTQNDSYKRTFAQIADQIEANFPEILHQRVAVEVKERANYKALVL